ncbi:MAG: hypothetical protein EOL92_07175, partial [Bacteroidia bacterium]|nr:hypothetical protein [Bacteroidia bacterium]
MFDFDSLYDTGEIVFQNAIREAIDECKSRIRELKLEDDEITTDRIITDISMYAIMDRIVMTAMNDFALFVSDSLLQHIREKPEY